MKVPRVILTAPVALVITFVLFFAMRALIEGARRDDGNSRGAFVSDFIRIPTDSVTQKKVRERPQREPPPKEPPPPKLSPLNSSNSTAKVNAPKATFKNPGFGTGSFSPRGGFNPGKPSGDQDATPVVRVQPMYPRRAAERGIEGYVVVKFRVGTAGQVGDPRIIDEKPAGVVGRDALKAVRKWKYNPKVVNGKAIEYGVKPVKLDFTL